MEANQNDRPKPRRLHLNIPQKYVVSKPSIQRSQVMVV